MVQRISICSHTVEIGQVMILNQETTDETGNLPNLKNIHPVEIIEKIQVVIYGYLDNKKMEKVFT